jgi:2-polyprenyl-3-methyl-5-hydroxy-6-metoxy-1,4-benzoquinol methylase
MDVRRVALIYDDTLRPETSGTYCRRALDGLVEVEHFVPARLDVIPRAGFDLYLNVDDGLDYHLPSNLRPSAWWAIDTHLDYGRCAAKARDADLVFAAQRDGAARLAAEETVTATWLPLACDPEVHRKHDAAKRFDVAFVGNLFPGPREELLHLLRRRFRDHFIGNAYFDAMAEIYSASRLVFNRSLRGDINMRVFEALGCGSLLLTDDLSEHGLAELFRDGVHLATYRDAGDLIDKAAYYLARESVRERIAVAGRAEVVAGHTYRHRMETILRAAESGLSRTSVRPRITLPAEPRDLSYYAHARPEILALVPEAALRVLDVGCGVGRLGEAIRARQGAEVTGVEVDVPAAEEAKGRLARVVVGDVERPDVDFDRAAFDCVVCGDVIEHLEDPDAFLGRARGWLRPGGTLVASLPNARHYSVVGGLLAGDWTYEAAGLLDETHLGFYTRRDMVDLFERSGYRVERIYVVPGPGHAEWTAAGSPGEVRAGRLHIGGLPPEEAEEFFVYQFLLVATSGDVPAGADPRPPQIAEVAMAAPRRGDAILPRRPLPGGGPPSRSRRPPMRFTQDFRADFDQFDFDGSPFAFARFGDGERSILLGRPVATRDGWAYDGGPSPLAAELEAALRCDAPGYYLGISDRCCDREAHDWYRSRVRVTTERLTFANVFVNANYRRFRQLDLSRTVLVSSCGGDFAVPEDLINGDFDLDGLVDDLLGVDRPILVAAGPAACVIVHKYWLRAGEARRAIVDVGSALDEVTKGQRTRFYQVPGSATADRVCRW